jgi:hypothetical protein
LSLPLWHGQIQSTRMPESCPLPECGCNAYKKPTPQGSLQPSWMRSQGPQSPSLDVASWAHRTLPNSLAWSQGAAIMGLTSRSRTAQSPPTWLSSPLPTWLSARPSPSLVLRHSHLSIQMRRHDGGCWGLCGHCNQHVRMTTHLYARRTMLRNACETTSITTDPSLLSSCMAGNLETTKNGETVRGCEANP